MPERVATTHITALPKPALKHVGKLLLISHPQSVLSHRCTCRSLRDGLAGLAAIAESRCRVLWDRTRTTVYTVSADGSTVTNPCPRSDEQSGKLKSSWACGPVLPTSGLSTWDVVLKATVHDMAAVCVGVCDAECISGWGVNPNRGLLWRKTRNPETMTMDGRHRPLEGMPDGMETHIGTWGPRGCEDNALYLREKAEGVRIQVNLDAGPEGSRLFYRLDDGVPHFAEVTFPAGRAMRPWAFLNQWSLPPLTGPFARPEVDPEQKEHDALVISGWVRCMLSDLDAA